jgi:hypothetical protein
MRAGTFVSTEADRTTLNEALDAGELGPWLARHKSGARCNVTWRRHEAIARRRPSSDRPRFRNTPPPSSATRMCASCRPASEAFTGRCAPTAG